jgi:hypothetical protein
MNTDQLDQFDCFLKLSLRAQSQRRSSWEAISAIQNPPVSCRQTNIVTAQQINNGASQPANNDNPPAEENENPQDELLEQERYERLDTGTMGSAIETDPSKATLGEVHRIEKS